MVKDSITRDILWVFREYDNLQQFLTQTETASLLIGSLGLLVSSVGISGSIPAAVGALGLSSAINEVVLRIYYNKRNVWEKFTATNRLISITGNLLVGIVVYMYLVEGAHLTPAITTLHFALGIIIWFVAGIVYMRTYKAIAEEAHEATRILVPSMVTVGYMAILLVGIPMMVEIFISESATEILQKSPKDVLNNATVNGTQS